MTRPLDPARSVLPALQAAVYARLTGPDGQAVLGGVGVHDAVPEDAPLPYVSLGEGVENAAGAHDRYGRSVLLTFHVWSRYRGYAEATQVVDALVRLLDHQHRALAVDGHAVTALRFVDASPVPDPDPDIRHVPVRFRAHTEQEE